MTTMIPADQASPPGLLAPACAATQTVLENVNP
jgi:hypothetical protein